MPNLTLSCGLLAVPITVSTGTDSQTAVARKGFTAAGNEAGMRNYDKVSGENVERADVIYKATADSGALVELTNDEVAAVEGPKNGAAEIVAFAPRSSLLRDYVVVKWDQVRPTLRKSGQRNDPGAERAFALLCEAMRRKDTVAIIHAGQHWVAMTPEGYWLRLAFSDTVRPPKPLMDVELNEAEVVMAESLVDAMGGTPEPVNTLRPALMEIVNAKAEGIEPPVSEPVALASVSDLLGALEATLAAQTAARAATEKEAV